MATEDRNLPPEDGSSSCGSQTASLPVLFFTEIAGMSELSQITVRRKIASGDLTAHRFRSRVRIGDCDFEASTTRLDYRPAGRQRSSLGDQPCPDSSKGSPDHSYLTVQEVAELARCEHRTVRRAIKSGDLKASFIGGRWIMRETAVEAWFEARANDAMSHCVPKLRARRMPSRTRSRPPERPGSVADLKAIRDGMAGA